MAANIPPKAMKYLKHLPTIANWIQTNKQISGSDMFIFRTLFSEPYRMLKNATVSYTHLTLPTKRIV